MIPLHSIPPEVVERQPHCNSRGMLGWTSDDRMYCGPDCERRNDLEYREHDPDAHESCHDGLTEPNIWFYCDCAYKYGDYVHFREDDIHYDEDGGNYFCLDCWDRLGEEGHVE